jgi:hypothetical protein
MLIASLVILLFIVDFLGYFLCYKHNNDVYLFKWRLIPFIWIFLFKYKKTYSKKEIKELFYHYKEKNFLRSNMQISKNEIDLFIDTNL